MCSKSVARDIRYITFTSKCGLLSIRITFKLRKCVPITAERDDNEISIRSPVEGMCMLLVLTSLEEVIHYHVKPDPNLRFSNTTCIDFKVVLSHEGLRTGLPSACRQTTVKDEACFFI